jgi:two-component system, NarL family, sensor histidine kinase UhpB
LGGGPSHATVHVVMFGRFGHMPLFWRVFATYVAVLVLVFLLLVFAPVTVSIPVALTELVVLGGGLAAMLVLTLVLLRPAFRPLVTVTSTMRTIDPLTPGQRVPVVGEPNVAALARAFNDMLERLEHERRESARQALTVQERERRRVARELHDEVGQIFTAIMLQIESLASHAPPDCNDELEELRETARVGATDVRRIAARLRPEALEDLGLQSALSTLAASFGEQTRIAVDRAFEPVTDLDPEQELVVYRVAQEALTNVARHARASTVDLSLRRDNASAVLRVRDDGRGLPDGAASSSSGIRGMRERAMLIGASLTLRTVDAGGTEVELRVPMTSE